MPQLDPSSYSSQLFWLTVSFIVLYVLLARMLLPRVQTVLAERALTIGNDIEQAKRMEADAEMAQEHYEKALLHARMRCQAMLSESQAEMTATAAKQQALLDEQIEKKMAESDTAIAAATKQVQDKLAAVAVELTGAIAQAVINHKPDAAKATAAVDAAMKKQGA